jgi:hypothetical protein
MSNSALTQFSESRTGIDPRPHPNALCCGQRLVHSMCMQFRCEISGISLIRNQLELQELNRVLELRGVPGNQREFIGTEFRESNGTSSVDETDSAMFNIAE